MQVHLLELRRKDLELFGSHLTELLWLDGVHLMQASFDVVQRIVLLVLGNYLLRCNLWICDSGRDWVASHLYGLLLRHS